MLPEVRQSLGDVSALVVRNLRCYLRLPDALVILLVQPLIVLLLFRYILAGESKLPDYVEFLMPGIFTFAVVTGSGTNGVSLAEDIASGVLERLRTLPIARSTFLVARATTDIVKNALVIPLVGLLGVAVGFRIVGSVSDVLLAAVLLLALGWMFAWVSMAVALFTSSADATQGAAILISLVFCFVSSGVARVSSMPSWLQPLVKMNPVTHVDNAVRALLTTTHGSTTHDVVTSFIWIIAVLLVMIPFAVVRYSRGTR